MKTQKKNNLKHTKKVMRKNVKKKNIIKIQKKKM